MTLPAWLAARLRDENPDGVTRGARLTTCDCGVTVLRGLDDDHCALPATAGVVELDHFGEYLALARGLRTYHLARRFNAAGAARWELDPRYPAHIAQQHRRYPVIPEHRCGIVLPHWRGGMLATMKRPAAEYDGPPPF